MAPSAVRVDPVDGRKDREAFRLLPHRLYAEDPFWVAPPNKDIARFLHPKRKHAFYGSGDIQWMLARRDGRVVGRIAAIENRTHNAHHSDRTGFFGFFEGNDFGPKSSTAFWEYWSDFGDESIDMDFKPYIVDGTVRIACNGADLMC